LFYIIIRVFDFNIHYLAFLDYGSVDRIDETAIRSQVQLGIALKNLFVEFLVDLDAICFN